MGIKKKTRPQNPEKKDIFKNLYTLFEGRERVPNTFESKRYTNKIENRITFKIKTEYYLELLTPETMKLRGSTKSKITKDDGNGENVPYL